MTPPPAVPAPPAAHGGRAGHSGPARPPGPPRPDGGSAPPAARAGLALTGAALCVLAAVLLGFAASLTVVGHLQHARDQQVGYDDLREQLAEGTAPVGQRGNDGKPLPLGAPVALLDIPALGVHEVVGEGTTSGVLMSGPGHRRDTPLPGQAGTAVIMGRQWGYGSPFGRLDTLARGATIEVMTGQGKARYRVSGVRRAGDALPAPSGGSDRGRLTLITATGAPYTPAGVLRVDAELTTPVRPGPPRERRNGWIGPAEEALHGDNGAWPAVFLWTLGLFLAALTAAWAHRVRGRWQTWLCAVPVLTVLGLAVAGAATRLLPNLL
ncbi:class E sortase [Streptomyces sp. AK02-01A]|uniref:sortase n=1 Tax=Streptomyces sp. AK02-01A TaxID=3028648 RepID=UPI00299FDA45|nr:class E sortase [Streptomyces sp. AK02-01A]MDX3852157.1 class E sortase [Streptomyces sp. AK02-01A]